MNVSGINMNQLSFGRVRQSAAKRAIQETNGDIEKLKKVKELIDGQKDNLRYDVIASKGSIFHSYQVIKVNGSFNADVVCPKFESACEIAETHRQYDDKEERLAGNDPEFAKMARGILAGCKD